VLILWVARIVREKGIDTFVRALRLLAKDDSVRSPWRVLIAGTGPDLPALRRALPEGDDKLRVTYLGHAGGGGSQHRRPLHFSGSG
jgi:glycosyltransferase involved in cell wall biosynthesis